MYNEDLQDEAVELMAQNGLNMARFLENKNYVLLNAVVGTEEDGDFWYGDIDLNEDSGKLRNVAVALNKSLLIKTETTGMVISAN